MENAAKLCQCVCGAREFEVRLKRDEQVGLLTCAAGHHSLLLDSRDYWADVLQDGRPKITHCRCGGRAFRVNLRYEFREDGDVRTVQVCLFCAACGRENRPVEIDIKYSPTDELVKQPLDPIEEPWRQPKRREITAFWKPRDAERFATHLVQSHGPRVFAERKPYDFSEVTLAEVEFYPELKHDLLFTNMNGIGVPEGREPENKAPFLRLNGPFHIYYSMPKSPDCTDNVRLLHYIRYSLEVVERGHLQKQPGEFLNFAQKACEWLGQNFVSSRGKNTADNPEEFAEYLRVKQG